MSERKEDIQRNLEKLSKVETALEEIYKANQDTIRSLSWYNSRIIGNMHAISFAQKLYGSFSESEIDNIPDAAYPIFVRPLENLVAAGRTYEKIRDDMIQIHDGINELCGPFSSSSGLVSIASGSTATSIYSLSGSVSFDQSRITKIVKEFLAEIKIDDDISYIRGQLPRIQPDISEDFQHFIDNYFASGLSPSKFQELIGCRSLLFFKFIFAVADSFGVSRPTRTRREQIATFVYGNNPNIDQSVEDIVDATKELWDELSDQDPSGYSVKMGNVTPEYVELIFNKVIIVFSTLLKQREIHFRP